MGGAAQGGRGCSKVGRTAPRWEGLLRGDCAVGSKVTMQDVCSMSEVERDAEELFYDVLSCVKVAAQPQQAACGTVSALSSL